MKLELTRKTRTENSTIGELKIDGNHFCFTLEPTDRGLTSEMSVEDIAKIKIPCKTAIPTGTYNVIYTYSPKHNRNVPLLENVKDFGGVEMHIGNYPKDTEGCLLCGLEVDLQVSDKIDLSTAACEKLWSLFENASASDIHTITIA